MSSSGFGKEFTGKVVLYLADPSTGNIYPVSGEISSGKMILHLIVADSKIMVPVDMQSRYKPAGMTLYSGTVTASGNSADIDVSTISALEVELKVTAVSGTSPTLDVYIEGKFEATGDYKVLASQTGITSTGTWFFTVNPLVFRYIRVRWVVGGTSPSFTFTVAGQAVV